MTPAHGRGPDGAATFIRDNGKEERAPLPFFSFPYERGEGKREKNYVSGVEGPITEKKGGVCSPRRHRLGEKRGGGEDPPQGI